MARTASNPHTVRLLKSTKVPAALQANLQCSANVAGTLPNVPVAGGLTFTYQPRFTASAPMDPGAGTTWNKYCVDEREGVIAFCDGDHGEPTGVAKSVVLDAGRYANGVRYFNYVGPDSFHGVAAGEDKYILRALDTYRSGQSSGLSTNPNDGNYMFTVNKQIAAANATRPPQLVGYKTITAISGGMMRIWRGTAANKIEVIWEIPDGTPKYVGDIETFTNQPANATCKSIDYLPEPGHIKVPEGIYLEVIPNDPAQPFVGGIAIRMDYSRPAPVEPRYAPASDYDNYHWYYSHRAKKMFWINSMSSVPNGRDGIFDLPTATWTHGNSGINRQMWQNGPYWTDYVATEYLTSTSTIIKNCPNGYSEALDKWVLHNGGQLWFIERNPFYPASSTKPYRQMIHVIPSTHGYRYTAPNHNQSMNSGIVIGEWFYFIKPMTGAEVAARFGFNSDTEFTFREFWRVRIVPPYNEFQQLAPYPYWKEDIPYNINGGSPMLSQDEPSNSVVAIGERLAVYDIESDSWADYSPANWEACSFHTGGFIRSRRQIIHKGGAVAGTNPNENWWYRETITGGEKPPARWVPMEMDRVNQGGPQINNPPWQGGKHWRFMATDKFRLRDGTLVQEDWVFQVGGDYAGTPYSNFVVPGYPFAASFQTFSGAGLVGTLSGTEYSPAAADILLGYTALTAITQDIVVRDTATRNDVANALYTIPAGTANGADVNIALSSVPRATAGLFPHFTAQQRVLIKWGKRFATTLTASGVVGVAGDYYDSYSVTAVPANDIVLRDSATPGAGSILATIPAGSAIGTTVVLSAPVLLTAGIYANITGVGGVSVRRFVPFTTTLPRSRRALDSVTGYMGYNVTESPTEGIEFYNAGPSGPLPGEAPIFTIPAGAPVGTSTVDPVNTTRQVFSKGLYIKYLGGDGIVRLGRDNTWAYDSGRQDCYRAPVAEINGKVRVELWMNQVAFYPWPGGPDPATTPLGPNHPDGCIMFFDRDGYLWVGPYFRFQISSLPNSTKPPKSAMYRVTVPDKYTEAVRIARGYTHPATDTAMGDTWEEVPQVGTPTSFGALFGGTSNAWGAYDEIDNVGVVLTCTVTQQANLRRFPCTPTNGVHTWTTTPITLSTSAWKTFCDALCRRLRNDVADWTMPMGSPTGNFSGELDTGPQVVVGDHAYAMVFARTTGGTYADNNIAYMLRVDLRDPTKYKLIALPQDLDENGQLRAFWHRNFDALPLPGREAEQYQTINEYREVKALGHLIVFGPPAAMYSIDDAWCFWFNTYNEKWTIGKSYREMMLRDPTLPKVHFDNERDVWSEGPRMTKSNMVTVRKTGELWVPTSGNQVVNGVRSAGMIKYRIW